MPQTYKTRTVRVSQTVTDGYYAEVEMTTLRDRGEINEPVGTEVIGGYAFVALDDGSADVLRGEIPDVDGTPVVYTGSSLPSNYPEPGALDTVPVDVLEALDERDLIPLDGVEAGWQSWEGRPEWSTTYVDVSDATPADLEAMIDERRDDDR
jgi:hypothetical protein